MFPLLHSSKKSFEVLRLGLEGTNPRISIKASLPIKINLPFRVTLSDMAESGMDGGNGTSTAIVSNEGPQQERDSS